MTPATRPLPAARSSRPLEQRGDRPRRPEPDPLRPIAESRHRLERLHRMLRPADQGTDRHHRRDRYPTLPDRLARALAFGCVPALLAVQAWQWGAVHAAYHPLMLAPVALAVALAVLIATRGPFALGLRAASLPGTLLLMTAVGFGGLGLYRVMAAAGDFEHLLLGITLGAAAGACTCAGGALAAVATGPAIWGHRLIAVGLSLAVGAVAHLLPG